MEKQTKTDIYADVTNKIIAALEKGTIPWLQPWQAGHVAGAVSRPLRSGSIPYKGINILMLWASAMEKNFSCPLWLTYKQAAELKGQVKKGEKGSTVVYFSTFDKKEKDESGNEETAKIPFMKGYSVFNAEQIEGLPEHFYAINEPSHESPLEKLENAEQFFAATGAEIRTGGNSAYYRIDADYVQIPELKSFRDVESYYATIAHETTHWTRHESRLDRDLGRKAWGDAGYAMEELVAELGAAFLCADLGITPEMREDHAAYIGSWLKVLKNDKKAIFAAASQAQKAVDYLQSLQVQELQKAA